MYVGYLDDDGGEDEQHPRHQSSKNSRHDIRENRL
jgi:hypothetical protein